MRMPFATHPLQLLAGLSVWALWFVVVYGGLSVACSAASADATAQRGVFSGINLLLAAVTLATASGLAWAALACGRAASRIDRAADGGVGRFIARCASALHVVAALSTLFVGFPLLLLWPCI